MIHIKVVAIGIIATIFNSNYLVSAFVSPLHGRNSICSIPAIRTQSKQCFQPQMTTIKMAVNVDQFTNYSPSMRTANSPHDSRSFTQRFLVWSSPLLKRFRASALPFIVQLAVMVMFSAVHPAFAKAAKKNARKNGFSTS